jgi:hypothetical protein
MAAVASLRCVDMSSRRHGLPVGWRIEDVASFVAVSPLPPPFLYNAVTMPEPTLLQTVIEYLRVAAAYWWVLLPGGVMVLPDTIKWHHPNKEVRFPFWLRLSIAIACIFVAQFLAYRNQALNLARVIEEKKQLSIQVNAVTNEDEKQKREIARLSNLVPKETSFKTETLQEAVKVERFFRNRARHQPTCNQTSTMTPEQQRVAIEPCTTYTFETMNEYSNVFAPKIMSIVERFKSKGINVGSVEQCVPQGWCSTAIPVQLRAFALRLDENDNIKP